MIGAQSFGGGPSTIQLIRQELIYRRNWLSEMEFTRLWTLATLVPGINLLGFAILAGRRLGGGWGIPATLAGMLLPSAAITTALTAGFTWLETWPPFHSILAGIIPATAGLMFVNTVQMGRPVLKESQKEGWGSVAWTLGFILVAAGLISFLRVSVVIVLILAAVAGAFLFSARPAAVPPAPATEEEAV